MRNSFTSADVADATLLGTKWNDFYTNLKRSDLTVFPARGRGETFSFAHALECEFQRRLGSRFSRDLAKIVFRLFVSHIRAENIGESDAHLEQFPGLFLAYKGNPFFLVFVTETANDPTIFVATSDLNGIEQRIRALAVGMVTEGGPSTYITQMADHLIVVNVAPIISRLALALDAT